MAAISTSFFGGLDIEGLVEQFRQIELGPRISLESRRDALTGRKQALNDLDSSLSALFNLGKRFSDIILDVFNTKTGESSDTSLFTVSAGADAQLGAHDLSISRLASIDTRVSQQYVSADSDFTLLVTDQSFGIVVAHPTDADPGNTVEVTVTVSAATFSQSNDDVLAGIATAINNAMTAAVTVESIDSDEAAVATVVSEASGQSRLILRSGQSGETYELQFNDTSGLLGTLEVNAGVQSSGTSGGFITAAADLSAQFTLDGLAFTRDSNFVEDALEGVGLQLLNTTSGTETITISADTESVKAEVQDFIDTYNAAIELLNEKTQAGGVFRGDITYSTLRFQLRSLVSSVV
ncbi:MAG: flagellar filament capping protein FliD, partial [Candidatus Neomarinimicrobiota bacterium]